MDWESEERPDKVQAYIAGLEAREKRLREALETIRDKDQRQVYERCPECISDSCSKDKRCDQMPFSSIGDIAVAALDKGE